MPLVISIPCLAAALLLVTGCGGFHAGYVSAGGAPASARSVALRAKQASRSA